MRRLRVLYVSPLKALVHDVNRNLRSPLAGIARRRATLGETAREVSVAMRTGDTPAEERREFGKRPPDILVTTPESLYLLLTSQAREALRGVEWVIVDEIHALAGTKRGAHLALSLERLEALCESRRSASGSRRRNDRSSEVAGYLGGREGERPNRATEQRRSTVTIVDAGVRKPLELQVVVPVEDMAALGEAAHRASNPAAPPRRWTRAAHLAADPSRILELIRPTARPSCS